MHRILSEIWLNQEQSQITQVVHIIGYIGLVLNLASMAVSNLLYLRALSLVANAIYILYGILLDAPPLIIGCSIAVLIQAYGIFTIKFSKKGSKVSAPVAA